MTDGRVQGWKGKGRREKEKEWMAGGEGNKGYM